MELDETVIGITGEAFTFDIEKRHVKQFAEAIGDLNPLYTDESHAADSCYGKLIVPPTFLMAISASGGEIPLDLDTSRMLHGEQEFIYHRHIFVGDRLHCQMKVTDLYEKTGENGNMQFLVIDTEMADDDKNPVAISRMNIIYRSAKGA